MFTLKCKNFLRVSPPIVIAMMACLLLVFFATSAMAYSGGQATSKKTSVPIVIDAELDDPAWQAVRPDFEGEEDIVVDPQDWYQVKEGSGSDTNAGGLRVSRGQIDGDDDLKVVWMTTWDDDYLYFAFEVTDDNVNEYAGALDARDSDIDGLLLLFDTKHDAPVIEFPEHEFDTGAVAAESTYQADDNFWSIAPLTTRDYPAVFETSALVEAPILNDPANAHVAGMQTGNGYNAEVRLPWSIFEPYYGEPLVPQDGMVFGFDITFTDIDPTYAAPEGGAMAWSSDFENDNSPAVLGELFLSTEPAIAGGTAVSPAGKLSSVWGEIKNR
jgi:hypothetical protein